MNDTARRLGMTGTSYTDPSGLDPSTTSTAADQVRLGMAAMRVPVLAAIAARSTAVVPVAGLVRNYNTLLGQDGIAGLKTGGTQAAGGCILIAAWHQAGTRSTLIVVATFGQPGTAQTILPNALQAGHMLVRALDRALGSANPSPSRARSSAPPAEPGPSIRGLRRHRSGPTSLPIGLAALWNARMFVGDEVCLEVSFAVACERLTRLTGSGALITTSEDSYSRETGALARVGAIGLSKLVRVQVRELARTEKSAGIALRWEATGPGGALFPVLDADVRLTPDGEHDTLLSMAGSYRPPLGSLGQALDQAILHRVAAATIRGFMVQVAARIGGGQSGGAAETPAPNGAGSSPPAGEGPH